MKKSRARARLPGSAAETIPPSDIAVKRIASRYYLGLAVLFSILLQVYLWPHITDDAYISFRYARNLAAGNGLVFNPGEHVEGFSNPLWTLTLAALFAATGLPLPDIARSLGFLCALGTLVVLWRVIKKHFPADSSPATALVLALVVLSPGFHVYATAGLEGPLFGFLLTLGVTVSLEEHSRARPLAALVLGLAGITRPEGPLYAFLWFLSTVRPSKSIREIIRGEFIRASILAVPIIAWEAFRLSYYGSWLPNTAVAKLPGVFDEFTGLAGYVTPWLISLGGPFAFLLWFVIKSRSEMLLKLERMTLALVGANLIFVIYARGDWMSFGRFIVPLWPVVGLVFGLWLSEVFRYLRLLPNLRFANMLPSLPLTAIALCSLAAWYPSVEDYLENRGINTLMRGEDQVAVGVWISENITADATVATTRLGGIGYEAEKNIVWDWLGLTDAEEARHLRAGRPGTLSDDPIVQRKPDVIAAVDAPADWGYQRSRPLFEFLHERYVFVMSFPQGVYGSVDIWIRKERVDQVLVKRSQFYFPTPGKVELKKGTPEG